MSYLVVNKNGTEYIFSKDTIIRINGSWEYRYGTRPGFECVSIPKGTIEKIIGKELSWNDEPFELK